MVVAVPAVCVVQVAIDDVVGVVAMRDRVVTARRTVDVIRRVAARAVRRRAGVGVCATDRQRVLVDMACVRVVKMPVVQEVLVPVVLDLFVAAARPVLMVVAFVGLVIGHLLFLLVCQSSCLWS